MKGNVKFFNRMKGFGFIAGEDGKEYFVHQTGLKDGVSLRGLDPRFPKFPEIVMTKHQVHK